MRHSKFYAISCFAAFGLTSACASNSNNQNELFYKGAMAAIRSCVNVGRDCATFDSNTASADSSVREKLAAGCLNNIESVDYIPTERPYNLTLSCTVEGVSADYTATADPGSESEVREPVVTYVYR